ncbi:hypothetical protein NMY22_g16951 [Coprinellus aureogranulatus]|nr:hypothetical protein NMY22_g16951 [Coprinellus aureogranulatus]
MLPRTNDTPSYDPDGLPSQCAFSRETQRLIDTSPHATNLTSIHKKVAIRIQELESEIQSLKTCHNAATFTCRLPVEILSSVFLLVQAFDEESRTEEGNYTWTRTSHVCRHWRLTAIGCAILWTSLDFSRSTEFLERSLERSSNAPLSIYCREGSSSSDPCILARALAEVNRIRSLKITVKSADQTWFDAYQGSSLTSLLATWTETALLLEHLDLKSYLREADMLPPNFLAAGAPKLSWLRLYGHFKQWPKLPFPSMTTLQISSWSPFPRPNAEEFFDAFTQMPLLQTLKLASCLPFLEPPVATRSSRIAFGSLKTLYIYDSRKHLNHFLQWTRCSVVMSATLAFGGEHPSSSSMQRSLNNILDFLCQRQGKARVPLRQLRYTEMGADMYFDPLVAGDPTLRHLSVSSADAYITIKKYPAMMEKCFDFETLALLKSDPGKYTGPSVWYPKAWRFFGRLPNLETIILSNVHPSELRCMLQETLKAPAASTAPFPRLRKLEIVSVRSEYGDEKGIEMDLGLVVAFLISAVKSHRMLARPFPELHLGKAMRLKENHVSSIRGRFPELKVVWDGDNERRVGAQG